MAGINRRDFARLGGAALAGAMAVRGGVGFAATASDTPDQALALKHVAPELRPAAQAVLDSIKGMKPFSNETLPAMRPNGGIGALPVQDDIPVQKQVAPGMPGQPDVTVYIINASEGASRPAILHTHGGGFILGAAKWEVGYLQNIARELDCVIVTVEYRLAPETRYTGSIEDNYAGLRYLYKNAASLGVDSSRIALLGESAGGGHAALLALVARDRGEIPLAAQILVYPMLDDRTGSTRQLPPYIGVVGWDPRANKFGWKSFLGTEPGASNVPAAAVPARRNDLSGLPPTFIGVGGVDLFVDEDIEYGRHLTEAGVPTELLVLPGAFHGFDRVAPDTGLAKEFTRAKMNAVRRAFGQPLKI
ncbi:alpha/beta hydrolase [Altericroceibacterium indicum]|uniref:alpha/beta hydrolase n=1 Tax=Altericroceibacterium indicum TaxID=374177 RepID=UPI00147967BA|nr:alpha/beta hydrolase [Altericroceibacterium indicum]